MIPIYACENATERQHRNVSGGSVASAVRDIANTDTQGKFLIASTDRSRSAIQILSDDVIIDGAVPGFRAIGSQGR